MNRCPITYEDCGNDRYSQKGIHLLSRKLNELKDFPYSKEKQIMESRKRSTKMSIQGVQPKLSAVFSDNSKTFEIVDTGGTYIIKPQTPDYDYAPENEDLTMKLAALFQLETPVHGLIYSEDGSLSYFIKRFDRTSKNKKLQVEDFAQLSHKNRKTKYDSSMENVVKIVDTYCTMKSLEKNKLFYLTLFNFITGNEDNHLKNFSLIIKNGTVSLSPCYDLINTTILGYDREETALPIDGKKRNITPNTLFKYFAKERLGLEDRIIEKAKTDLKSAHPCWMELIGRSFLPDEYKQNYIEVVESRLSRLGII